MNVLQLQTHMGHPTLVSRGYALASNYKANHNIQGKKQTPLKKTIAYRHMICIFDSVTSRLFWPIQDLMATPVTEGETAMEMTSVHSGRGFSYNKHGLQSANLAVKQE